MNFDGRPHERQGGVPREISFLTVSDSSVALVQLGKAVLESILKVRYPYDVDNGNKCTEAEGDDEDDLLLSRQPHTRQDWHWENQNSEIRDNVNRRRGYEERNNVGTNGALRNRILKDCRDRLALYNVQYGQGNAGDIDDDKGCPRHEPEDTLVLGQCQVEDQNGGLGGHEHRILVQNY